MSTNGRTAYIDFVTPISGVDTAIRIFETETHVFVYANQHPPEMHLYNDILRSTLQQNCRHMRNKEFTVICNLANHESLDAVTKHIVDILNE